LTHQFLATWPMGQTPLNSPAGAIVVVANAAIVPAGSGGAIGAFATDPTQVVPNIDRCFVP
jgi:hypothetical protein